MKFTKQKRFRKIVLLVFMDAILGVEMQIGKKIGSITCGLDMVARLIGSIRTSM